MQPRMNRKVTQCDGCERVEQCYKDGVVFGFTLLEDVEVYPELNRQGHADIRIGEHCPKKK